MPVIYGAVHGHFPNPQNSNFTWLHDGEFQLQHHSSGYCCGLGELNWQAVVSQRLELFGINHHTTTTGQEDVEPLAQLIKGKRV